MNKVITLDVISSTNKLSDHFRGSCQVLHETTCVYRSRRIIIVLILELAALIKITMEHETTHQEVVMLLFLLSEQQQECVIISTGNQESTPTALKFLFHPSRHKFVNL